MGDSQSISLLSYGILEKFDTNTFLDAYPSFDNDSFAKAYLNEANPCRALELRYFRQSKVMHWKPKAETLVAQYLMLHYLFKFVDRFNSSPSC